MGGTVLRRRATFFVEESQNDAMNTTMCILQNFGPIGFLVQEENGNKKFKSGMHQRIIETADICPICQDEFFSRQRLPVTYCRKGCGNSVHTKCMKIWKEHQAKERSLVCRGDFAKLGDLNLEIALCENRLSNPIKQLNNLESNARSIARKFGTEEHKGTCFDCNCSPIFGRVYCLSEAENSLKTDKTDKLLCSKCFNRRAVTCATEKSTFYWKDKESESWRKVVSNIYILCGFERKQDTEDESCFLALSKPLCQRELGQIAKWVIKAGPRDHLLKGYTPRGGRTERKESRRVGGLLAPGQQCRICLMHFHEGEESMDDVLKVISVAGTAMGRTQKENDDLMNRHRGESDKTILPLEPKSVALCRISPAGKIQSAIPVGPICKAVRGFANPLRRISDKYWPKF
ncbi:hypothetical protein Aperf_G00000037824 [Anoplocephala perfoliata]